LEGTLVLLGSLGERSLSMWRRGTTMLRGEQLGSYDKLRSQGAVTPFLHYNCPSRHGMKVAEVVLLYRSF
jgi:hypothetical protein